MSKEWVINLPYPPSLRGLYKPRFGGGLYMSPEGKKYKQDVKMIFLSNNLPSFEGFVRVRIEMYPPDRRKRDIDNILKITQDALQDAGVIEDDSKILTLWVNKNEVRKGGGLDVFVKPAHEEFKAFIAEKSDKLATVRVEKLWGAKT